MRAYLLPAILAAALLPCPGARAAELPAELAGLEQEGKKWFDEAGKTDQSISERNESRKKAWVNLYRAKEILDKHWDAHPEDQDKLENRITSVGQMVFWLKKESPMGLLETTGVGPKHEGGGRKNDWGDKPAPEKPGNAPGDSGGGAGGSKEPPPAAPPASGGGAPAAAAPEAPKQTIEQAFAVAEAYAKKYRADISGVMQRYLDVTARFPDQTANPLFQKAAQRAGAASSKLRETYRKLRDDDPGSLKNVDDDDVKRTVLALTRDLGSLDALVREKAAAMLGVIGSGEAAYPLVDKMKKEKEAAVVKAMADALVAIGGRRAILQLHALKDDELSGTALDCLQRLTAANPVDRRLAIEEVGAFALAKDEPVAGKAVDFLVSTGKEGAYGLVKALDTKSTEIRLKIIPALGATGNPKVARPLARFLLLGDNPNTVKCRNAAHDAIKPLGEAAVPYLFAGLRDPSTKAHTAVLLREITGKMFSMSRPGDWVSWWKESHPDWKEEKE
jgi:hypothetical protein